MDTQSEEWGVALMKLQANLPDTLPGQNVTILLFGDVEIKDAAASAPAPVLLNVTASRTINVRGGPSTNDARIGALTANQTVIADGRNEPGDWLRIQLEDGAVGWVSTPLVTVEGDPGALPVKGAGDTQPVAPAPAFGPMQAFYFKSGVADAPCETAPDSGILIQTPQGAGKIDLRINEVSIELSSTAYLQAQPGGEMTVNVIEDQVRLTAFDVARTAPAGTRLRVPLDANGIASGAPVGPEPYNDADLAALPVGNLERPITVARALTPQEMPATLGTWVVTFNRDGDVPCEGRGNVTHVFVNGNRIRFEVNDDSSLRWRPTAERQEGFMPPVALQRTDPGVYAGEETRGSITLSATLRVVSPERIEGELTLADARFNCKLTNSFQMELVEG